jgi:hypothetical protein
MKKINFVEGRLGYRTQCCLNCCYCSDGHLINDPYYRDNPGSADTYCDLHNRSVTGDCYCGSWSPR